MSLPPLTRLCNYKSIQIANKNLCLPTPTPVLIRFQLSLLLLFLFPLFGSLRRNISIRFSISHILRLNPNKKVCAFNRKSVLYSSILSGQISTTPHMSHFIHLSVIGEYFKCTYLFWQKLFFLLPFFLVRGRCDASWEDQHIFLMTIKSDTGGKKEEEAMS